MLRLLIFTYRTYGPLIVHMHPFGVHVLMSKLRSNFDMFARVLALFLRWGRCVGVGGVFLLLARGMPKLWPARAYASLMSKVVKINLKQAFLK